MEPYAEGLARGHFADSIVVEGVLPNSRSFAREELIALAQPYSDHVTVECYSGRHIRTVRHMRGVLLTRLLDEAGMPSLPRSKCKQMIVAVTAKDGYVCLFTWHELYNSAIGKGAMLLVEQDDCILPARAGGLQLISLRDLRLGPRQAAAVTGISVRYWNQATHANGG